MKDFMCSRQDVQAYRSNLASARYEILDIREIARNTTASLEVVVCCFLCVFAVYVVVYLLFQKFEGM